MTAARLALITGRISHHASWSGYDHLAYTAARNHVGVDSIRPERMPLIARGPIGRAAISSVGRRWYEHEALAMEATAARRLSPGSDTDAVHSLWGDQAYAWSGYWPRGGKQLTATFHQPERILTELSISSRALRRLDGVVILAECQRDFFSRYLRDDQIHLIPHGVDVDFFAPGSAKRVRTCLIVGQWLRDVDVLVETATILQQRDPAIEVRLVGASPEVKARTKGMANVNCLPRITDEELLLEYQSAGVFLMPVTESTANCAFLEALACGAAIVASDIGGMAEYAGLNGAVLVDDAVAMAEEALSILDSPTRAAELGAAARTQALEFDWTSVADQLVRVMRGERALRPAPAESARS